MSIHLQDKCSETGRIKGQISRTIAKTHWNLRFNFLVKTNSNCTFFIWPLYHFLIGFLFVGFLFFSVLAYFFYFFLNLPWLHVKIFIILTSSFQWKLIDWYLYIVLTTSSMYTHWCYGLVTVWSSAVWVLLLGGYLMLFRLELDIMQ